MTPREPRAPLDPTLTISGGRDLVALVGRLLRERSWDTLTALFTSIGGEDGMAPAGLGDLDTAARLVGEALAALPPPKNPRGAQADELRALALAAAEALSARCARPPLTPVERRALDRAATLFTRGGDHRRAALAYEDLGADERAADAWGALGDLDRMEAAHDREARRAASWRASAGLVHRFEALVAGGERRAALAVAVGLADGETGDSLRRRAAALDRRLCRGRAVTLRAAGGAAIRVAVLPTELGRDPAAGISLRDPAISRRHAILRVATAPKGPPVGTGTHFAGIDLTGILVEDAGSRAGVRLNGARLDAGVALPLRGAGELALGPTTTLRFEAEAVTAVLEGTTGLDRGLRALVGPPPLPLGAAFPEAMGVALELVADGLRLERRPDIAVRVDGDLIGPGCDLLHGDVIEVGGLRLEVE